MGNAIILREVTEQDLPIFFEQQRDPVADHVAAFGAKDPSDRDAFMAKWAGILGDDSITKRTVLCEGRVAGNVMSFLAPWSGKQEVSYWIGREYWGKGVATDALRELIRHLKVRPLYPRAAKDNIGSLRVLQKCGFTVTGCERSFATSRGEEIDEVLLELAENPRWTVTLDRIAEFSDAERTAVRLLAEAVYPPRQTTDWPGRDVEWSTPEWCVRVRGDDDVLVSYVGVYIRAAQCDGRPVRIGGIGNVKTHPAFRRQGLAALAMRRATEFVREQPDAAFALLVCEPRLLGYYGRLGWQEFGGRLLVTQHGAACEFTFSRVMTHGIESEAPVAGTIDLCGPPW